MFPIAFEAVDAGQTDARRFREHKLHSLTALCEAEAVVDRGGQLLISVTVDASALVHLRSFVRRCITRQHSIGTDHLPGARVVPGAVPFDAFYEQRALRHK